MNTPDQLLPRAESGGPPATRSHVIVSGDFSSGTTVLFTLFRKTGDFHCLYEPDHERLLEYLIYPLRPEEHHIFVEPYFDEYKGFRGIHRMFKPEWGVSRLFFDPAAAEPEFFRYWSYLLENSFARRQRVMMKVNRLTFRLGWLKKNFPQAKIVHIYRDKERQWNSIVRRNQEYFGREDVGQDRVDFAGFNIARWCEDLKGVFPELDARESTSGFARFSKLWDLSFTEHRKYADLSINHTDLTRDFDRTCEQIGDSVGYQFDVAALRQIVVPGERGPRKPIKALDRRQRFERLVDRMGLRYARVRLRALGWRDAALSRMSG